MAYSKFTIDELRQKFNLGYAEEALFEGVKPLEMIAKWKVLLDEGKELALPYGSEQARKTNIVYPILMDLRERNNKEVMIYAGLTLNADSERGLNGECDFILSMTRFTKVVEPPILAVVEAERHDLELGQGQCAAQLLGATIFNEKHNKKINVIYGCVTTGSIWQFMKLENNVLTLDTATYYLQDLEILIGIFQEIIEGQTLL